MPDKLVRLIAPPGTDECNFGTVRYRVHDDGTVTVPAEVATDLVHGAGFALAPDQPASGGVGADVPPIAIDSLGDPIE
jgi:hypothetical protein